MLAGPQKLLGSARSNLPRWPGRPSRRCHHTPQVSDRARFVSACSRSPQEHLRGRPCDAPLARFILIGGVPDEVTQPPS